MVPIKVRIMSLSVKQKTKLPHAQSNFVLSNERDEDGLLLCGCDNHEDGCILDPYLFADDDESLTRNLED